MTRNGLKKRGLISSKTRSVRSTIEEYLPKKVLSAAPTEVSTEEANLPRGTKSTLAQLLRGTPGTWEAKSAESKTTLAMPARAAVPRVITQNIFSDAQGNLPLLMSGHFGINRLQQPGLAVYKEELILHSPTAKLKTSAILKLSCALELSILWYSSVTQNAYCHRINPRRTAVVSSKRLTHCRHTCTIFDIFSIWKMGAKVVLGRRKQTQD